MSENPFQDHDVAKRDKAVRDSIRAKGLTRPKTNNQGTRLDHVFYKYDENGQLLGAIDPITGKVDDGTKPAT
jgi:hypothetical protein